MIKTTVKVKVARDAAHALDASLKTLISQEVLVGVPRTKTERKESEGANNAVLAYVHDNGSPSQNIPARPFMQPGIKAATPEIQERMGAAARALLGARVASPGFMYKYLTAIGLKVQSAIRSYVNEGIPPPLAASTLAARLRKGFASTKPLVVSGQLRNSINFVVRNKEKD